MTLDDGAAALGRRWPLRVAVGSAAVAVAGLATTGAGGWYYADELLQVRPEPPDYPVEVIAVVGTTVTLSGPGADEPGVVGLEWPGGFARVGREIDVAGEYVLRSIQPYPQLPSVGTQVRVAYYAAPDDLRDLSRVAGVAARRIEFDGPLGRYPATYLPGDGERWMVHVHGRGATRGQAYRLIPAVHRLGLPQLSIAYRNDDGAPEGPHREYGLGWTESEDLAAALDWAREQGAREFVLTGYSMGGAIVGNLLRLAGSDGVAGVVYDSPVLSWLDILAYQARLRGVPAFGATVAASVVRARTGINVWAMDQVAHADRLDVPVLLFHGSGDTTVPVTSSDRFAAARPDLVTYLRGEAEHVRNWNLDPAAYEAAVTAFLTSLPAHAAVRA
ncbi:alpha/beta hydrolase [Jiangella anatolica]|uniref:alpha/beta hydrolase n=1 Tax=Jiangella anatolica TaxID=2670374 RepID=UPI0011B671F8|nr:prolyl oligopeptidase family serine peptidase [Jiangella anatolica]